MKQRPTHGHAGLHSPYTQSKDHIDMALVPNGGLVDRSDAGLHVNHRDRPALNRIPHGCHLADELGPSSKPFDFCHDVGIALVIAKEPSRDRLGRLIVS